MLNRVFGNSKGYLIKTKQIFYRSPGQFYNGKINKRKNHSIGSKYLSKITNKTFDANSIHTNRVLLSPRSLLIYLIPAAIILLQAQFAYSDERRGAYVTLDAGSSKITDKKRQGFRERPMGSVGTGYDFNDLFRTDVKFQYRGIQAKKGSGIREIKDGYNTSVMFNGYINMTDSKDGFIPYVTLGVGYGVNKLKGFSERINNITITQTGKKVGGFVWSSGVGGIVNLDNKVGIDLSYRYVSLGKMKGRLTLLNTSNNNTATTTTMLKNMRSHEFGVGLIIRF